MDPPCVGMRRDDASGRRWTILRLPEGAATLLRGSGPRGRVEIRTIGVRREEEWARFSDPGESRETILVTPNKASAPRLRRGLTAGSAVSIVACRDCDLLHALGDLPEGATAVCRRCSGILRRRRRNTIERTLALSLAIGRWSMVDIFAVTILVALVHLGAVASIDAELGAVFFGAVVVLTMLGAESFDPRLLWEPSDGRTS